MVWIVYFGHGIYFLAVTFGNICTKVPLHICWCCFCDVLCRNAV